jgi:hypothetical protein
LNFCFLFLCFHIHFLEPILHHLKNSCDFNLVLWIFGIQNKQPKIMVHPLYIQSMVQQIQDMYLYWIILSLFCEPDTGISIFLVGEKIHCLGFGFTDEKNVFFSPSIRPNILCIKYVFGGISHLRQYRILVSFPKTICVYCLRKVRQHKSGIFGYSNSETIQINAWYRLVLCLLQGLS